jgi:hypothetical protein
MGQNRNKLIDLFIGNMCNAILHKILEKAIDIPEIASKYNKEILNSWNIAKIYREKINPINSILHSKDTEEIEKRIIQRVKSELLIRISKGYKNINIEEVEKFVKEALREMKIIE